MVVIRLSRQGRKNRPFYFIVVANKSARRDGRHIEKIGSYDPLSKEIKLDMDRIEYWLSVGAQPSDTVKNIIKKHRSSTKEAAAS